MIHIEHKNLGGPGHRGSEIGQLRTGLTDYTTADREEPNPSKQFSAQNCKEIIKSHRKTESLVKETGRRKTP